MSNDGRRGEMRFDTKEFEFWLESYGKSLSDLKKWCESTATKKKDILEIF